MTLLALILALSTGEADLPLTLAGEPAVQAKQDLEWSIGGRLGVATAFDSDDASFLIGAQGRLRILSWFAAEASIDFQTSQAYESGDIQVRVFPIQISGLFYLPVEWPVKPYGVFGLDLTIVDVQYSGALGGKSDKTTVEAGAHFGAGVDYPLTPSITLDADLRFVFLGGSAAGDSFDYFQFTVGVNFKLK